MKKPNQEVSVIVLIVVAIVLAILTSNFTTASIAIVFTICIPFAVIGMVSTEKQAWLAFIASVLALLSLTDIKYALEVIVSFIMPSIILGKFIEGVKDKDFEERTEPLYMGIIIFILSTIAYFLIAKYIMNIDVLKQLLDSFNKASKLRLDGMTEEQLDLIGNITAVEMTDMIRNLIASILFIQSCICVFLSYYIGGIIADKITDENLRRIRLTEFYLPGNSVVITFAIYVLVFLASYIKLPLNTISIMGNLQIIFNIMFMAQGISVGLYFIKTRIVQRKASIVFPVIIIVTLGIMGGGMLLSMLGMLDCIMDFRKIKTNKSKKSI